MDITTKRPMPLGTIKLDVGTLLTVPDRIGNMMIARDLGIEVNKKKSRRKHDDNRDSDSIV